MWLALAHTTEECASRVEEILHDCSTLEWSVSIGRVNELLERDEGSFLAEANAERWL
tara:strand:+ start:422 stop:592 length:171 start_codon:yes stop_codon:yes gene_type:complete